MFLSDFANFMCLVFCGRNFTFDDNLCVLSISPGAGDITLRGFGKLSVGARRYRFFIPTHSKNIKETLHMRVPPISIELRI